MINGSVSNPQARRTKTRRQEQEEWRKRPEYRAASEAFLKKHPYCEVWLEAGIKIPATEIHHPNKWSYQNFQIYVDFENNGAMAVSGPWKKPGGGHYACHHNLKVCPICRKRKCNQHAEGCQPCLREKYPALAVHLDQAKRVRMDRSNAARRKKRVSIDRHSCDRHLKGQGCKRSASRCTFSAKKAPGCLYYLAKKVRA